jgi:2-dehydropantoate 2-reductase
MDSAAPDTQPTGIYGAGSVGCYVGGRLADAGGDPVLVGRKEMAKRLAGGFTVSDYKGERIAIGPGLFRFTTDSRALAPCCTVLVCVKSRDTAAAGAELASILGADTLVVSCQNGVSNAATLRDLLPDNKVLCAMIGFNVAQMETNRFHCGTRGAMMIETDPRAEPLRRRLREAGIDCSLRSDMAAAMWGKLILNLNNSVNALSGLPLRRQLATRAYRRILAAAVREALAVLSAAGIRPAKIGPAAPRLIPMILQLPDWLFRLVAANMLKVDALARSSMAEDLERGRPTEIDQLNGEIVALAEKTGIAAPVNARLAELVREASERGETPAFSGGQLLDEVGLTGASQ